MAARRKPAPHPVNVRLPADLGKQLDRFARLVDSPKSAVIVRAVEEYLAWRIPQQEDLKLAIAEAKKGNLVENAEVIDWLEGFIARHAR
jgi:predicted transcriptional regulator